MPIARVHLSVDSAVLMEGETLKLSVTVSDSAGEPLAGRDVLLYSMNSKVATVTPGGSVDARSYGSAMIVARAALRLSARGGRSPAAPRRKA